MGKENNHVTGIETEGGTKAKRTAAKAAGSPSPESTSSGRGRGGRGGSETEEKSPIISLVETPELDPKEEERRKKRAESQRLRRQQAKEKKEGSSPVKPKTKADPTQIKIMLSTVSIIMASREGMEHWSLSESEVKQIAEPLANIFSKYEALANISTEYADHLALIMAGALIIFPRLVTSVQIKKNKKPKEVKIHARNDQRPNTGPDTGQQSNGKTETNSRPSHRESSTSSTNVSPILSDLLPATGGF